MCIWATRPESSNNKRGKKIRIQFQQQHTIFFSSSWLPFGTATAVDDDGKYTLYGRKIHHCDIPGWLSPSLSPLLVIIRETGSMGKKLNQLECCNSLHLLCLFDGCDVETKGTWRTMMMTTTSACKTREKVHVRELCFWWKTIRTHVSDAQKFASALCQKMQNDVMPVTGMCASINANVAQFASNGARPRRVVWNRLCTKLCKRSCHRVTCTENH